MERSKMTFRGIQIEQISLGWVQIFSIIFFLGGITYMGNSMYKQQLDMKKTQEIFITKYVPIMDRLVIDSENSKKLNVTLERLNQNLTTITALRTKEDEERKKLVTKVDGLTKEISELKIETTELKIEVRALQN